MNFSKHQLKLAGSSNGMDTKREFAVGLNIQGDGIRVLDTNNFIQDDSDCEELLEDCQTQNAACQAENETLEEEIGEIKDDLAPPDQTGSSGCWSGSDSTPQWSNEFQCYDIWGGSTTACLAKKDDTSGEYVLTVTSSGSFSPCGPTSGSGLNIFVTFQNAKTGTFGPAYQAPINGSQTWTISFDSNTLYNVYFRWNVGNSSGSQVGGTFSSPPDRFNDDISDITWRSTVEVDEEGNPL